MEFRMKIADVLMDVSSQYEMLAEYCRDYMVEDSAEEVSERLVLTMEDIEKERTIAEKVGSQFQRWVHSRTCHNIPHSILRHWRLFVRLLTLCRRRIVS